MIGRCEIHEHADNILFNFGEIKHTAQRIRTHPCTVEEAITTQARLGRLSECNSSLATPHYVSAFSKERLRRDSSSRDFEQGAPRRPQTVQDMRSTKLTPRKLRAPVLSLFPQPMFCEVYLFTKRDVRHGSGAERFVSCRLVTRRASGRP